MLDHDENQKSVRLMLVDYEAHNNLWITIFWQYGYTFIQYMYVFLHNIPSL